MAIVFNPDLKVSDLLELHPKVLDVLVECGFAPLRIPGVRTLMANTVSLREACEKRGIDLESVLGRLSAECGKGEKA